MTPEIENIFLEQFKAIRDDLSGLRSALDAITDGASALADHVTGIPHDVTPVLADIAALRDRSEEAKKTLSRIDSRLEPLEGNEATDIDDFPTATDPLLPFDQLPTAEEDQINREIEEAFASGESRRFPNFNPVEFEKTLVVARPAPVT